MKNKGFTLIELLAVIVILAIIALIATPIILGIINDTRGEARKRSAEAVRHAVETAYLTSAMKVEANGSQAGFTNNDVIKNTKIDNERSRVVDDENNNPSITTNDGVTCTLSSSFILTCKYGEDNLIDSKDIKNGTSSTQETTQATTRYYYWGSGSISGGLPKTNIDTDVSNITIPDNHPFYLAFDSADGKKIDAAYVCFTKGNPAVEYCIQGGDSETSFTEKQGILDETFPGACSLNYDGSYYCDVDGLNVYAYPDGNVSADDGIVIAECSIGASGNFDCNVE